MSNSSFKDLFSHQAQSYAKFRPTYSDELFSYLNSLPQHHDCLWDCGTGNGQAAIVMAQYFKQVIATDPSEQQLKNASTHDKVTYKVATAESSGINDNSINMVTVAQALHWFNFEKFNQEVQRVLKKDGVIAVWCYQNYTTPYNQLNEISNEFYFKITAPHWAPERKHIDEGYANIPFPYKEIDTPQFTIEREMTKEDLLNYLNTWSPINMLLKQTGENLVETWMRPKLEAIALPEKIHLTWPVIMRVGYM